MSGHRFHEYRPDESLPPFERLLQIFLELMLHTEGDVSEALNWMNQLDRQYNLTDDDYGMGDFVEDLKKEGYIRDDEEGEIQLTGKVSKPSANGA